MTMTMNLKSSASQKETKEIHNSQRFPLSVVKFYFYFAQELYIMFSGVIFLTVSDFPCTGLYVPQI
jgi:hypothetical protein